MPLETLDKIDLRYRYDPAVADPSLIIFSLKIADEDEFKMFRTSKPLQFKKVSSSSSSTIYLDRFQLP